MPPSNPLTALVTGASRGVGKGVATALAEGGFRVFATGRSIASANLPGGIRRIPCDHTREEETAGVFAEVAKEGAGLELVVNAAWGGYERMTEKGVFTWTLPFWEQPAHRWQSMMDGGVRTAFMCASHAARMMVPRRRGLIVNLSYWAAQKHLGNAIYGMAKAATDKMTRDMAHELRPHHVAVVSLYPGLVRTEAVLRAADAGLLDLSNSESPEFSGRVILALSRDPQVIGRSGQVLIAAELALEFGVTDVDGRRPRPLTLASA
ncbi:MAG TPA: SDR family NAD(P)-dependent oxidoreductase [Candidatus Cybelea sp.]|nr:SDR family NAD(P)-dependent oxidoreductase [Candidatus Cybelea sp.]